MRRRERTIAFLSKKNGKWEIINSDLSISFKASTSFAARQMAKALKWKLVRLKDWDT